MSEQSSVGDILNYINRELLAKKNGRKYSRWPIIFECGTYQGQILAKLVTKYKKTEVENSECTSES